ncbi:unnamed protein product, partial [Iphiclides podalirius]
MRWAADAKSYVASRVTHATLGEFPSRLCDTQLHRHHSEIGQLAIAHSASVLRLCVGSSRSCHIGTEVVVSGDEPSLRGERKGYSVGVVAGLPVAVCRRRVRWGRLGRGVAAWGGRALLRGAEARDVRRLLPLPVRPRRRALLPPRAALPVRSGELPPRDSAPDNQEASSCMRARVCVPLRERHPRVCAASASDLLLVQMGPLLATAAPRRLTLYTFIGFLPFGHCSCAQRSRHRRCAHLPTGPGSPHRFCHSLIVNKYEALCSNTKRRCE